MNTIVVGAPYKTIIYSHVGAAYVLVGSGATYTETRLTDNSRYLDTGNHFGQSVAVGFSYSVTLVAVGSPGRGRNLPGPQPGVVLFTQSGASFIASTLSEPTGNGNDEYGTSLAMTVDPKGNPTVVGGAMNAPGGTGNGTGTAALSSGDASVSVRAVFGNGSQMLASPTTTYNGTPFHLVAGVVDGNGVPLSATGVTFTVNANGGTGGRFTAGDPTSASLHVTTNDGTNGTTAGQTGIINLFPSDTGGQFTVSASVDGTAISTTYTLTIIPSAPKPTINPVTPVRTTTTAQQSPMPNAVTAQPAGLSPPLIIIDTNKTYAIHVNGSGFVSQTLGTTSFFTPGPNPSIRMDTVYVSSTELLVYVTGYNMLTGLTADTTASINVYNPPSSPGGTDGGISNPVTLALVLPRPAPAGSTVSCSGSLNIIAIQSSLLVPPSCQIVDGQGNTVPGIATGKATGFVGSSGGELVSQGGGNLISQDGAGLVTDNGSGLISDQGAGVISNDGGSFVHQNGAAKPSLPSSASNPAQNATTGSAPKRTTASPSSPTGDYIASTDANSIIMAPPILSNGIPGTYTRTLAVDGIVAPVTYKITNLNPHDGHPTTITALSRTAASTGDPAFTLTVTDSGFVSGSVLSYGGVQLATTSDSATLLHATIPANLLKYSGTLGVLVINPDPNGGASLPATFTVTPPAALLSLTPADISPGSQQFTLKVTGTNFLTGAAVKWNGTSLTTTLTAMVPANLVATAGTAQVTVASPLGVVTTAVTFTIAVVKVEPPPRPGVPPVPPIPGAKPLPAGRSSPASGSGPPPAPAPPGR